jgi:predicted Mrr-cat superfamily restriction endonuclease
MFKRAIIDGNEFADNERIFPSNDNVFRVTSKITKQYSIYIATKFRNSLLPTNDNVNTTTTEEQNVDFENIRAKYLLDLEKEKATLKEEEKEYKAKKQKDREDTYNKMIDQNIQAKTNNDLNEADIEKIMSFFNNIEGSLKGDNDDTAIIITGERYNEMIIQTVCDAIKHMLENPDSSKQIISIILNRFDYMLKEFIDIMQNNGILKMILLSIIDRYPFIFSAIQVGVETALNNKIESVSKSKALGEGFITKEDIQGDYALVRLLIN